MVNLEKYKQTEKMEGVIKALSEMTLRAFLETEEKIKAFCKGMTKFPKNVTTEAEKEQYRQDRLDGNVLVVSYAVTMDDKVYTNSEFLNLPTPIGWGRSKLKAFKEKNDLPSDTNKWLHEKIRVTINKDGYLRLMED